MGSQCQCTCLDCKHQFTLTKGGGWVSYQKICALCGTIKNVPRKGPANFVEGNTLTRDELLHHLNTPSQWSRHGGGFDSDETKLIHELTASCDCGGELIPEWDQRVQYRCPQCRSLHLNLVEGIIFD